MQPLRSVNLNLITILRELLRKGSVTYAAESLNMSQSAVSEALSRLRYLFDDEILIQEGRKFRLSALAERMRPTVESSLRQIESLLRKAAFDPAEAEGAIKIATVDYLVLLYGEKLVRRVAELAPKVTLHFSDLDNESVPRLLKGNLDFILGTPLGTDAKVENRLLALQEVVCIAGEDSMFGETITEEEFWSARHVAFSPGDEPSLSLRSMVLRTLGKEEFNAVLVQNFLLIPYLVRASKDMLAILPRPQAEHMAAQTGIRILDLPIEFPRVRIVASWESARKMDPLLFWFRQLLFETADVEGIEELAEKLGQNSPHV